MVKAFDVVWCNFPYDSNPYQPAKERPGIVKEVYQKGNETIAVVAYGTSNVSYSKMQKLSNKRLKQYLIIGGHSDASSIGLHKPTYFDLSKTANLPYNSVWFNLLKTKDTAVVGSFENNPELMLRLKQCVT